MKNSLIFLLLFIANLSHAYSQISLKTDTLHLNITKFQSNIGYFGKSQIWDINKPIKLPTQPTFLSVSLKDNITQFDLICIIQEPIKLYDTIRVGNNNTVNFFNLSGGEYDLTFINKISLHQTKIYFSIEPVFWERWWFSPFVFLILTIILGLTFYALYLIRLRQQARTQLIRDNIARDLHDDMGSYLSSISILSQNVEKLSLNDPVKARQSLQKIGEIARQVMDTMGDIVWSINPAQDSMEQIIERMKDLGNEIFLNQAVEMEFLVSHSITKTNLSLENRRDFFLIYKEALTNIHKYANASKVLVELLNEGNTFMMNIKDNGKGFDKENLPQYRTLGGNGLKNMQARAEKLDGKLMIESKIEEGTTIKLVFEM